MGTQHSSRNATGLPLRLSPRHAPSSASSLRGLGLEEAASSFASQPNLKSHSDGKGSPTNGAFRWHTATSQASSSSHTVPSSFDIEAGNADLEQNRPDIPNFDCGSMGLVGSEAKHQDAALAAETSQLSLRSSGSSCENLAPSPKRVRPKAKGCTNARPKWTRPRPSTAIGSRPSSSDGTSMGADSPPSLHPHVLANDLYFDQRDVSQLQGSQDFTLVEKFQVVEPPATPSTVCGSGLDCTQSSFSSASGCSSRPTTRSSTFSSSSFWGGDSKQVIEPGPDEHLDVLVDCTRGSRILASGAHTPGGELALKLSSVREAWGPDSADAPRSP